jgi:predicted transcriptional regulator
MDELKPLQGELQIQIMAALRRLGSGTVADVQTALPARRRNAYNTVQTVLNRLAERRLLERERRGAAYVYRPKLSEAEYVSRSIRQALAGGCPDRRGTSTAILVGLTIRR